MSVQQRELDSYTEDESIIFQEVKGDIEDCDDDGAVECAVEVKSKSKSPTPIPRFSDTEDKFQKNLDATQLYLNEIGFSPLLSAEEEVYFARKALRGCDPSRKRMIESNLRLVVKIARRYVNRGLAFLDQVEQGQASAFPPTPPGGYGKPSSGPS